MKTNKKIKKILAVGEKILGIEGDEFPDVVEFFVRGFGAITVGMKNGRLIASCHLPNGSWQNYKKFCREIGARDITNRFSQNNVRQETEWRYDRWEKS